jgi:hypothetical protein
MDAGLLWTAVGSLAGVLGVVLVAWQVRFQLRERRAAIGRDGHRMPAISRTRYQSQSRWAGCPLRSGAGMCLSANCGIY